MRRLLGLALILLFGPLPVLTLLASVEEPQCQMACCKRKGMACSLHNHSELSHTLQAGSDCLSHSSQAASALSFSAAAVPNPRATFSRMLSPAESIASVRNGLVSTATDPLLYQRPPPLA